MPIEGRLLLGTLCAAIAAYGLTPVAIRAAGRFGFYDTPAGYKDHAVPTPYLGGAALMAGFLLALLLVSVAVDARRSLPLGAGVAVLWVVGTIDDRRHLAPAVRVATEAGVAVGLWALGLGWDLGLGGTVDLALTVAWVLAVVNAFNLFDNMDGAVSAMALVVSAAVAVLGLLEGNVWLAATAGALGGSCLGFLPHNICSPARIFLGDGGSLPLGFAVSAIVMVGAGDAAPAWQALIVGLLLVGIPALDTALVVVSRRRRGISVMTGGRDHLTHRTRRKVRTARVVAVVLGAAQALVAALALFSAETGSAITLAAVLAYLVVAGSAIAFLEEEEMRLEAAADGRATASRPVRGPPRRSPGAPALAALAALGLGAGLSPLWFGFYDSGLWVPLGLVMLVACAAALLARPLRTSPAGVLLLGAGAGLAVWTLLSSSWGESAQQAVLEGNRALVLVAVLALVLALTRTRTQAVWLVGALLVAITVVAAVVMVRMLGDDHAVFSGGRLNLPLGYVNAEATVFAMGLWMALALAERRRAVVAGLGAGLAILLAGLTLLSVSRGAAAALLIAGIVVTGVVPGRLRRIGALALVGGALAATAGPLLDVSDAGALVPDGVIRHAAVVLALWSAIGGAAWAALVAGAEAIQARAAGSWSAVRAGATTSLVVVAIAGVAGLALNAGRAEQALQRQYDAFVALAPPIGPGLDAMQGGDRLVSGSGNRFDYWRVAWGAFKAHPVQGLGAGNFDVPWFRLRAVTEDVRQPHSIELQVLSETGIVGGVLLLGMVLGGGLAVGAAARRARISPVERALAVASVGGATTWFVHTSVDWMHLMPGVTAITLCLLAVAARPQRPATGEAVVSPRRQRPFRLAGTLAVASILVVAGASLARQGLAERERDGARSALATSPATALRDANRSLRLDGDDVPTYYVKAAALARFDRGEQAEAVLREALAKEPSDFVTWALLGDLLVRRHEFAAARRSYARAHRLNPRDPGLASLALNPRGATG